MPTGLPQTDDISAAVITGGHAFDVPGFHALFRSLPGVDSYIQHMENFVADVGKVRDRYDVVVFYNMPREDPEGRTRAALEALGTTDQGVLLLHHGILSHREWAFWDELVGIRDRMADFGFKHGVRLRVDVADTGHPITQGLEAWDMVDETYRMNEPGEGCQVLLTVDHPESMSAIAWTRSFKGRRVFCFQSGHDSETDVEPSFRTVLSRGIQWCAGRI